LTSQRPSGAAVGEVPAASAPPRPGPGDLGDVTLLSNAQLPRTARAAVSGWLDGRVSATVLADALLLVSELVTNAFLHVDRPTGAPVRVRSGAENGSLWVEVGNRGSAGAVERREPSTDGSGGFGLQLVELLAADWGVTHVDGTEVWFTLAARDGARP
jgi:anti-sigma regulatory factor (Ser/Thr protein kinase)